MHMPTCNQLTMYFLKSCVFLTGQRVYIQGGASSPQTLVDAMCAHASKSGLKDVEVIEAPIQAKAPYTDPKYEGKPYILRIYI